MAQTAAQRAKAYRQKKVAIRDKLRDAVTVKCDENVTVTDDGNAPSVTAEEQRHKQELHKVVEQLASLPEPVLCHTCGGPVSHPAQTMCLTCNTGQPAAITKPTLDPAYQGVAV